jgi:hypothetical protein
LASTPEARLEVEGVDRAKGGDRVGHFVSVAVASVDSVANSQTRL